MRKFIIYLLILMNLSVTVFAVEEYRASTYINDSTKNINKMIFQCTIMNQYITSKILLSQKRYKTFEDVLNKLIKESFDISVQSDIVLFKVTGIEMKYKKLKDTCSPVSSNPRYVTPDRACGKLIFDVDGFGKGSDKFISDNNTLQAKDQFVLYLYSDAVKPAYMSPEDLLLISNPKL